MSGNDFGKDGMAVLADLLKRMKPEHVELREVIPSRKSHNGLQAVLKGLTDNKSLRHLDISGNHYNG